MANRVVTVDETTKRLPASVLGALAKADVGLGNVDNTSDANKPVSSATQTALNAKAPTASPTFTGTVSGVTKAHVGLGSVDNTSDVNKPVSTAQQAALDAKAPLASPAFTGTPTGITKAHVGLGSVDNTSDAAKPVSSATQTALNGKANTAHSHAIADTTGLQTALDAKAGTTHSHAIADSTGLQTALDAKLEHYTTWTASTAVKKGQHLLVTSTGVVFRVLVDHTTGTVAPTVAESEPTTPGAPLFVWAAPGNSPRSLVIRNNANEITLNMLYILNTPTAPTSVANLAYVDAAVAAVTPPPRPAQPIVVKWNGSAWTYRDVVITAQPSDRGVGDMTDFIGNPTGSLPAWALPGDRWTKGGS